MHFHFETGPFQLFRIRVSTPTGKLNQLLKSKYMDLDVILSFVGIFVQKFRQNFNFRHQKPLATCLRFKNSAEKKHFDQI